MKISKFDISYSRASFHAVGPSNYFSVVLMVCFFNSPCVADNHKGGLSFSANSKDINDAFECVCVQHEIDHLDGITMFDREGKR